MVTVKNPKINVNYNRFGTPVLLDEFINRHKDFIMNSSSGLQTSNGTTEIRTRGYNDWIARVYKNFRVQIQIMEHKVENDYVIHYTPVKMYSKKLKNIEEVVAYLEEELNKFKNMA